MKISKNFNSKKQPLISVVLATYNREKCITKAIESVLNQTYKNLELLILDDSSNNKTAELILDFKKKDPRIVYIKNKIRLGFVKNLNKGIRLAKGLYIARLDDDDFWLKKEKLEKQVNFLENNPDYLLVGGGIVRKNEKGQEVSERLNPETDQEIRKAMLLSCPFTHGTTVFRKKAWQIAGGYYEEVPDSSEDWELWLKFGKMGKLYNFPEYFLCYSEGQENRSNFNRRENLRFNIELIKKYRQDYPNFLKGFFVNLGFYLYYFLPFKKQLRPLFSKIKKLIFKSGQN